MFGCLSPDCRLIPINRTKQWIPLVAEHVHHWKPGCRKPLGHRIVNHAGSDVNPRLVVAVVDGAAVMSISEGYPVRDTARSLVAELLQD